MRRQAFALQEKIRAIKLMQDLIIEGYQALAERPVGTACGRAPFGPPKRREQPRSLRSVATLACEHYSSA
jgi:hypothetical protein